MTDSRGEVGFVEEHRDELGIERKLGVQPLDRDGPREPGGPKHAREVDGCHTAGRNAVEDYVASYDEWRGHRDSHCSSMIPSRATMAIARARDRSRVTASRLLVLVAGATFAALSFRVARPAWAEGDAAQTQFDYGLAEMKAERFGTGCPALAESYRIDPHPGVLFTLAECENRWGKMASALTHYQVFLDLFAHMSEGERSRQQQRRGISASQRDRLRARVPRLAISLPPSAPTGTVVGRDGERLGEPSLGSPMPVDPGEHSIVASTPDGVEHRMTVTLSPGEQRTVVVDLSPVPPPAPPPSILKAGSEREPLPVRAPMPPPSSNARVTWMLVAGGVGAVALTVGAVTGAMVLGDKSTIEAHCQGTSCDHQGKVAGDDARAVGTISTIGFGLGAAAAVTCIVLAIVRPSAPTNRSAGAGGWAPIVGASSEGAFVGARSSW